MKAELVVAVAPPGREGEAIAGVARIEDGGRMHWVLSVRETALSKAQLMDCLALLALDQAFGLIPHILLPYSPPAAEFMQDGKIRAAMREDLSRTTHSMIRLERVYLRTGGKQYVDWLYGRLKSSKADERFNPTPSSHPFNDPAMPTWSTSIPPFYVSTFE